MIFNLTSKNEKVDLVPTGITVTGDWSNSQLLGYAPDLSGLTFTVTYKTKQVTPAVSPATYDSTGNQTVTFSYTEEGVTVSAEKEAIVIKETQLKNVGGIIFYIDPTAEGNYIFFDANGDEVPAPTVGTDCTGWTYITTGATKDKYYVVYNELFTGKTWTYQDNGAWVSEYLNTSTNLGYGKLNTKIVMEAHSGAYANYTDTIWNVLKNIRTNEYGGCSDWYIGSKGELEQLRLSGVGNSSTWFSNNYIWASSETSDNRSEFWQNTNNAWSYRVKHADQAMCAIRSFGAIELVSLTVSGDWQNTQIKNTVVDYTGLVFTATFSDRSTQIVTPTVSPSVWNDSGNQTATFTYTYNNVTRTATSTVEVGLSVPVGGIIFYIDNTADGVYRFWNADGQEVEAPSVGMDCTGWTYTVEGASKDKFYIVHNQIYTQKRWTYYKDGAFVHEKLGTSTAFGSGKANTALVMSTDNGAYITDDADGKATIWYVIKQLRDNEYGGCNDWYTPSKEEIEQLYASGTVSFMSSNYIWTSSENLSHESYAYFWLHEQERCIYTSKANPAYGGIGIRSF